MTIGPTSGLGVICDADDTSAECLMSGPTPQIQVIGQTSNVPQVSSSSASGLSLNNPLVLAGGIALLIVFLGKR